MSPKTRKILFTGGGTAGHIVPNIPLIKEFKNMGWETYCIILGNDIENQLLEPLGVKLKKINAGKLRRYFDIKNFIDVLQILKGVIQATSYIRSLKPDVVFSKGGYVALPVAIGAYLNNIPFIIHESDTIPSLTTKLTYPVFQLVCTGFPIANKEKWKSFGIPMKTIYTGIPVREEMTNIKNKKEKNNRKSHQNLLAIGGSLGSNNLNICIRQSLKLLTKDFNIIHICGEDKIDYKFKNVKHYKQHTFIPNGIERFIESSDIVITRGGATFLYELLVAKKPTLIVPLSKSVSRGDQISNAQFFKDKGYGDFIFEENLSPKKLKEKLVAIRKNKEFFEKNLKSVELPDTLNLIKNIIFNKLKQHESTFC